MSPSHGRNVEQLMLWWQNSYITFHILTTEVLSRSPAECIMILVCWHRIIDVNFLCCLVYCIWFRSFTCYFDLQGWSALLCMHSSKLVLVQFYHDDVIYPFKNLMSFNMTLFKLHICSTLQQTRDKIKIYVAWENRFCQEQCQTQT